MTDSETYNYDAFSFALEPAEYAAWQKGAPRLGDTAPDFELSDVDGNVVRLSGLRGRPVVLEFGSLTCPIFCGHNGAMDRLARNFPEAAFLVVYTREAHPGEIFDAHRNPEDKRRAASELLRAEPITRRVLIDDVEGTVHRTYGGAWDSAFVIAPDGRIVIRRAWNDPGEIEAALLAFREKKPIRESESLEMAPPAGRAFGEGLLRGGKRALLGFYNSAPPPVRARLENSESPHVHVRTVIAELAPMAKNK